MTDKLRGAEREAFERALAAKPDARFWNAADAMFWAWQARAALVQQDAQAVPQGWKLVPVEPTPEMRKAAADAWIDCGDRLILNKAAAALRAGIAASPTPPAQRVMLTDEEIDRLWFANASTSIIEPEIRRAAFARAVIEAYERKNAQPKTLPAPLEQQGNPYPST